MNEQKLFGILIGIVVVWVTSLIIGGGFVIFVVGRTLSVW